MLHVTQLFGLMCSTVEPSYFSVALHIHYFHDIHEILKKYSVVCCLLRLKDKLNLITVSVHFLYLFAYGLAAWVNNPTAVISFLLNSCKVLIETQIQIPYFSQLNS